MAITLVECTGQVDDNVLGLFNDVERERERERERDLET
jgi:hypothetical protein